jgi:hypothetical protein
MTVAKTLMTASIIRCKETTKHQVGHIGATGELIVDSILESPTSLAIVLDQALIYLWRLNAAGALIADTWHEDTDKAAIQLALLRKVVSNSFY